MRFIFNEDQIVRLKQRLSKENINEDALDDLIAKGADYANKGIDAVKDFISGLDVPVEKKSSDVPHKADFISDNVEDFYKILDSIKSPITQQKFGSMTRQQGVEAVQIGLQLLGYSLPRFGTDGLFGPETAAVVNKYKEDKNIVDDDTAEEDVAVANASDLNEMVLIAPIPITSDIKHGFSEKRGNRIHGGIDIGAKVGTPIKSIADGKVIAAGSLDSRCGDGVSIEHAEGLRSSYCHLSGINVKTGDIVKQGVVIGLTGGAVGAKGSGNSKGPHLHLTLKKNGQRVDPMQYFGSSIGDYYDSGSSGTVLGGATISTEMVKQLISDLKSKNITSDDIKKHIDPAVTTGGSVDFTDLDLNTAEGVESYKKICDNFIQQRNPGAEVNGEMMADAAERVFKRYGKYVPPELALAQLTLEGGISKNPNDRPIKTKNPFNVGNTGKKDNPQASFKDGVNLYYDLIARKYLVKGKTAADLVNDFKNEQGLAYAEAGTYEAGLKSLIKNIRDKNAPVYAQLKTKNQSTLAEELLNEADKRQAIKNAFGFNDDWANEFHNLSDKLSIWIVDTFVKDYIRHLQMTDIDLDGKDPKEYTVELFNTSSPNTNPTWDRLYKPKYEYIMHWVRAPRREPLNIRAMSLEDAYSQAQEWHDTLQVRKQSNYQETGDVFIDYRNADGIGYYWVHLGKGYCDDERERMGHCGRSNTGKLISFRKINEFGEGESYLTVDYRPGGIVGDFHRHGNKKPTSRFHKQIVDFLINTRYPVTQLTQQGVHRYEDNFQLADLSPEDLRKVYQGNAALRFDISNPNNWPEIIEAILNNEITFSQFSNKVRAELLVAAIDMGKGEEFSAKFTDKMVLDTVDDFNTISRSVKQVYVSNFADRMQNILIRLLDKKTNTEAAIEFFADALKKISQELFDSYQLFCGFIDHGFRKFNEEQRIAIISQRGIKRTLYSCSEILPFLTRFAENSPVDSNGNIAVKTEDGFWGLIKQNGETILHPQFLGVGQNKIDRTGKTYLIKNVQNVFYSFNPESGEYKKYTMKG
jgi:murein DD-endopeptidase MepM/ murein hydrolase activator NlpD